jgi:Na+-exporting ATPase
LLNVVDDNFATIVTAVAEGRRIFANIQKFVVHLMSGNISEIIALIIGLAYIDQDGTSVYPMSPVQILFLNMVTSSIPAMALGIEKARPDIMKKPPRASKSAVAAVFTQEVVMDLSYYGTVMGILTLGAWSVVGEEKFTEATV